MRWVTLGAFGVWSLACAASLPVASASLCPGDDSKPAPKPSLLCPGDDSKPAPKPSVACPGDDSKPAPKPSFA